MFFVLKSFINSLLYVKSNECRSALRKLQHSNPHNNIGKHLDLTSSRITTSEAVRNLCTIYRVQLKSNP